MAAGPSARTPPASRRARSPAAGSGSPDGTPPAPGAGATSSRCRRCGCPGSGRTPRPSGHRRRRVGVLGLRVRQAPPLPVLLLQAAELAHVPAQGAERLLLLARAHLRVDDGVREGAEVPVLGVVERELR